MERALYKNSISNFLAEDLNSILGKISLSYSNRKLVDLQRNAWVQQIKILKRQLGKHEGHIYFEFAIPRMGKRVDNILVVKDCIFVLEFKVGDDRYDGNAQTQVLDYTLDLKNFHEGSHHEKLVPVLVATEAKVIQSDAIKVLDHFEALKANKENLGELLDSFLRNPNKWICPSTWEASVYKPTPTIIEAAQALYKGHNVNEIARSDSGAINLSKTTNCLSQIIDSAKLEKKKVICFVTGVPGAGKTLAGLNIANERMKTDEDEHAVFLSGNGPLVEVLREALARDLVNSGKEEKDPITKKEAKRNTSAFIQNIHHFRDEYLKHPGEPTEKVVVFDEAQRAWNEKQASSFMKRRKGILDFEMSEPEFLVNVMNRHEDWCVIICLIGGGQEINTGEAGLEGWIIAFREKFYDWEIYCSHIICNSRNYIKSIKQRDWLKNHTIIENDLHLSVSVRSFRSENLSSFIHELLDINLDIACNIYEQVNREFPILITRNFELAKNWLKATAKGSERIGIVASSGAKRLRPLGIDVKNEIEASNWFLNGREDIRSSFFLEDVATEFEIQGLEIDWACVVWGANFYFEKGSWRFQKFKGSQWQKIKLEINQEYLLNTYRVLLTRARQGMIIFVPKGSEDDHTRPSKFYDGTWNYLKEIGLKEIK